MSGDPYTYVTVSIESAGASRIGVFFHTPDLQVTADVLDSGRPYLDITSPIAHVTISTMAAGPVTAAARYLADCERLHTGPSTSSQDPQATDSAA